MKGGMDFLPDSDKMEFTRLGYMIKEWEDIYYPTPIIVSPLVKKIEERMSALNLVIWGVLYHETLSTLRYGLTDEIKQSIREDLNESSPKNLD